MHKKELISRLAERFGGISEQHAAELHDKILQTLRDALKEDGRVEIRGFGSFFTRQREARLLRNPRYGIPVEVPAKRVPRFKPGKELQEKVNAAHSEKTPPDGDI